MFFENLIAPPGTGAACLDFRYKKYSTGKGDLVTELGLRPIFQHRYPRQRVKRNRASVRRNIFPSRSQNGVSTPFS